MKTKFANVRGFDYPYRVTNKGVVYVYNRGAWRKLKTSDKNGYSVVGMRRNGKCVGVRVHRLVARYFVGNPNHYTQINHKDENKKNNRADNLEWCSLLYNINYGNREKKEIPVVQFTKDGKKIGSYRSLSEAARQTGLINMPKKFRSHVDKNKPRVLYGFIWKENGSNCKDKSDK